MISEHELIVKIRELFPIAYSFNEECVEIHRLNGCQIGPTGLRGTNQLQHTIDLLESSAKFLKEIGKEKGLLV